MKLSGSLYMKTPSLANIKFSKPLLAINADLNVSNRTKKIIICGLFIVEFREIGGWVEAFKSSEARCGRIFLKFLHTNLALIYIHFCQLENFCDQRRFFWNVEKKKWSGFLEYFRNGQLERNFLCYESYRKNLFGYFTYW